jgi:O-antigen ligase
MPTEYLIYVPVVLLISSILFIKAKNKAFVGLFLIWLFGSPIFLNPNYVISLSIFGFDIQPNRLLFIVLTPLLVLRLITPRNLLLNDRSDISRKLTKFEVVMIGYILIVVFAIGINFKSIGSRTALQDLTNIITFPVVYFCVKLFINDDDFILLQKGVLAFALISVIVGAYQFFINPEFLRLGSFRSGFSSYYRANGLFSAEYDQGIFLILSIVITFSINMKSHIRFLFVLMACFGIFMTLHRLSWVALIITLGGIWFLYLRRNLVTNILAPLIIVLSILGALNVPWSNLAIGRFSAELINNRILADTLSGRVSQYQFSLYMIRKYPLGIGSYYTATYNQEAYLQGIPSGEDGTTAVIVHNGYLSAAIKYGILGLILFSLFTFISIFTFYKQSVKMSRNWYPLLMIMIIFVIFNLTNDFSFLGTQVGVVIAWLMGGYYGVSASNQLPDKNLQLAPQI